MLVQKTIKKEIVIKIVKNSQKIPKVNTEEASGMKIREKQYSCNKCRKTSQNNILIKTHRHSSAANTCYPCDNCPKHIWYQRKMKMFFTILRCERSMDNSSCNLCLKSFSEQADFIKHFIPHACERCLKQNLHNENHSSVSVQNKIYQVF